MARRSPNRGWLDFQHNQTQELRKVSGAVLVSFHLTWQTMPSTWRSLNLSSRKAPVSNLEVSSVNANIRRLWIGQSLALAGTQFGALAFPLVAITVLDATAQELGILAGPAGLPWLFFGLFVGVGVDRFWRRPILVAADLGRGVLVGWNPILAWLGILPIGQLDVITFVVGTLTVFFETAYQPFLPVVVDRRDLVDASAKLAMTESVTKVAGLSIADFVIQATTAPLGMLVDSASFLASAMMIRRIDGPQVTQAVARQEHVLWSLRQGLVFLWRLKTVRWFALSNATFMLFFTVSRAVVFIFYTRDLGLGAGLIGVMFAAGNIGALVGAAIATRVGNRMRPAPSVLAG